MRRLHFTLVFAFLLVPGPLTAQETIPLTFAWQPGLRGTVTQTMDQSTGVMGMQMEQRMVTRYAIEVLDHPEGVLIRFRDGEMLESSMPGLPGMPSDALPAGAEEFTSLMATASYDAIVDGQGQLVRIERDEATRARLEAVMEEMLAPLREMSNEMPAMFEGLLSEETLNATVKQSWNTSLGFRPGDEVVVGETYTSRDELPFPVMQNRSVLMDLATTVTGRVACRKGGAPDGCVRMLTDARTDPEDIRMMMEEMFDQMLANAPVEMEISMGAFEQTFRVEAITEPATLVPHRVSLTSDAEIEMDMMGQSLTTVQRMELEIVYEWEGR